LTTPEGFKKFITFAISVWTVIFFIVPSTIFADQYDDFIAAATQHTIISNDHFLDINSMNTSDIQAFLVARGSYLAGYSDGGRSAAQIIYDASHGKYEAAGDWNGISISESTGTINPEVILVFLQKEQSLISRTTYDAWAMTASMGYFCYAGVSGDNNGNNCKDIYEGFTKQVENGAWQLRYNYEAANKDANWWSTYYSGQTRYKVGDTITAGTSRTPPDSYQVTLANQATASCYRYTPYVFFGNYNVWNLFYNTYDFDSTLNTGPYGNDTGEVHIDTHDDVIELDGVKTADCRAYINNVLFAEVGATSWHVSFSPAYGVTHNVVMYRDTNGTEINYKSIYVTRYKYGDIDGDQGIGILDLSILASYWGQTNPANQFADINSDGTVNIIDLSILADNWTG